MDRTSILIAVASLVLSTNASAAVVESDYASVGDGLITHDLDNAMEWFDVAATTGLSANQAVSLYAADGFRLATTEEVIALFISAGIDEILDYSVWPPVTVHGTYDYQATFSDYNVSSPAGQAAVANLMGLLGFTDAAFGGLDWVSGYLADENANGLHNIARLREATDFHDAAAHTNSSGDAFDPNMPSDFQGSWLVRDTQAVVPLPAAVWLFGASLIGLIGVGRRQI